jgi:hypothetical protein
MGEFLLQKTPPAQFLAQGEDGVDRDPGDEALDDRQPEGMDGQGGRLLFHGQDLLGGEHVLQAVVYARHFRGEGHAGQKQGNAHGGDGQNWRQQPGEDEPAVPAPVEAQGCGQWFGTAALDDEGGDGGTGHVGGADGHPGHTGQFAA